MTVNNYADEAQRFQRRTQEQARREAFECPACFKSVHPSNWGIHCKMEHAGEIVPVSVELPISLIRRDGSTQTRVVTDEEVVNEYADDMRDDQVFPPVDVYYDGDTYWLADGFHRVSAVEKIGKTAICADIKVGAQRDALFAALAANQKRGLHRKNADKRYAVRRMLEDPEWRGWSDRAIADHVGVSKNLVRKQRQELFPTNNGHEGQIAVKVQRGDSLYVMNTSNIGKRDQSSAPATNSDDTPERIAPALPDDAPNTLRLAVDVGTVSRRDALEILRLVAWFPEGDREPIIRLCMDSVEKVQILRRLQQSMDYEGSSRTYEGIISTGGFDYGDVWCNFKQDSVEIITQALQVRQQPEEVTHEEHFEIPATENAVVGIQEAEGVEVAPQANHLAPLMTSDSPEWHTPPDVIQRVVQVLGEVDLDPCSNSSEHPNVPAKKYYTAFEDGLSQTWEGRVYMNPPYGREISDWIDKLLEEHRRGNVTQALLLLPARTDTQWFQTLREFPRCFIFGRLKFSGHDNAAPFPNMMVSVGCDRAAFMKVFGEIGDVYELARPE